MSTNPPLIRRIKPLKRIYAGHLFSKSKKCKLSKGRRDLFVHASLFKEKYLCPKNLHSLSLSAPGTPLIVQKLKSQSNIRSLFLEMSMQQAHHLNILLKLLRVLKKLRMIQLHAYGFNISTEANCLWYERLFKLCRRQDFIIHPLGFTREIMKKPRLPKFIRQISSLKQIMLNVQIEIEEEDDASLSNFTSLCKALATCHLDLQLTCFSDNINLFVPQILFCLLHIKNLKGLTFWDRLKNPRPNIGHIQIQENHFPKDIDFFRLFSPHKNLRKFAFSASFNALIARFFPFEELQELRNFGIDPGFTSQPNDNDFEILMPRVKVCRNLKVLNFRLQDFPLLTDISVKSLCNELLKSLPDLEILNLMLGFAPHPSHLAALRPQTCQYTPLAVSHLAESLPNLRKIKRLCLGFQIKELPDGEFNNLFNAISNLKTLEVLEISVFSGSITDAISSSIKSCLQKLLCLTNFALALRNCDKLTNLFLKSLSSAFKNRKVSKFLRMVQMNFEHSSISRESMDECASFIKSQLPSCYVYIVRR